MSVKRARQLVLVSFIGCLWACSSKPEPVAAGTCAEGCDDDNPCTSDVCKAGVCGNAPVKLGQFCGSGGKGVCDGFGTCAEGALRWGKVFGDASEQSAWSLAVDGAGSVVLTGLNVGGVDFGLGPVQHGQFLVKLMSDGTPVWSRALSVSLPVDFTRGFRVATDGSRNVLLCGTFAQTADFGGGPLIAAEYADSGNVFVAKFDPSGAHLWSKRFGDLVSECRGIAADAAGHVVVVGAFSGTIDFGGGKLNAALSTDGFLASFDKDGGHLWSKRFGDAEADANSDDAVASAVAVAASGEIAIAGDFSGTIDLGDGVLVNHEKPQDLFAARFDAAGNHIWSKQFAVKGQGDSAGDLEFVALGDGRIVLTGLVSQTVDFGGGPLTGSLLGDPFVAVLNDDGSPAWSKLFADARQLGTGTAVNQNGDVIVITANSSPGLPPNLADFGGGALTGTSFVAKFSKDGTHLWSKGLGGQQGSQGEVALWSLGVDSSGDIFLGGAGVGSVDFGGGSLACKGEDAAVASFGP